MHGHTEANAAVPTPPDVQQPTEGVARQTPFPGDAPPGPGGAEEQPSPAEEPLAPLPAESSQREDSLFGAEGAGEWAEEDTEAPEDGELALPQGQVRPAHARRDQRGPRPDAPKN